MTLNELAKRISFANSAKGFGFTVNEVDQKLLLAVSEICEAQEELRDGHGVGEIYYSYPDYSGPGEGMVWVPNEDKGTPKPEGFPVEIADAIIRLLHICHNFGIDIEAVIEEKLAYNATRPMKHGRRF